MTVPPRPVSGDYATSTWGGWVHDRLTKPAMARVTQVAGINVPHAATTKMTWSATEYDTLGLFDVTQQGFKIPTGEAGIYRFSMTAVFSANAVATHRWLRLFRNGSGWIGHAVTGIQVTTGEGVELNWSDEVLCTAASIWTMNVYHKNGADLLTKGTFSIRKVAEYPT